MLLTGGLMLTALSGCGGPAEPNAVQPPLETAAYSNLTDADTQSLLSKSLADAGIGENRISSLLDRVDRFNASVKGEWLTRGFERAAPTDTKYDPYEMQDLWTEKNGSFPGYNCRITAFGLFSEFVTAGADQPETQGEDTLFLDLETLAADPDVLCGDSTSKFCALFAPVTAADSTETEKQVKALQAGWSERGISFEESTARLISVVLHDRFSDTDNTLFIGHVGVLLPAEDGSLWFMEKVAFQEPYRLVKLQNRTELSDYLMEQYDTAWSQDTTRPFILENDSLMEGSAQIRWTVRHKKVRKSQNNNRHSASLEAECLLFYNCLMLKRKMQTVHKKVEAGLVLLRACMAEDDQLTGPARFLWLIMLRVRAAFFFGRLSVCAGSCWPIERSAEPTQTGREIAAGPPAVHRW